MTKYRHLATTIPEEWYLRSDTKVTFVYEDGKSDTYQGERNLISIEYDRYTTLGEIRRIYGEEYVQKLLEAYYKK